MQEQIPTIGIIQGACYYFLGRSCDDYELEFLCVAIFFVAPALVICATSLIYDVTGGPVVER